MIARRRRVLTAIGEQAPALGLAVACLLAWEMIVPLAGISTFVLPRPSQILSRMMSEYWLLSIHSAVTAAEVVVGFLLAAAVGIPTALAIFYSRVFERAVYPLLVALQTIPKVALAPLLILWLGYDWKPKIFLGFVIAFFPIVIATVVGLQGLDQSMVHLVRSMGATEWQTFIKLRLPAALPNIFGGLKVGIALAVIGAVIGEYVAAERGLGYLQLSANAKFDTILNFAALIMISLLGVVLFLALGLVEERVVFRREAAK